MFSLLGQVSEKIQTNTERLSHCVALWDDLKAMEQDINQWTSCSIAELTDSVTKLSDKERTETQLDAFQVRECAYEYIYIYSYIRLVHVTLWPCTLLHRLGLRRGSRNWMPCRTE